MSQNTVQTANKSKVCRCPPEPANDASKAPKTARDLLGLPIEIFDNVMGNLNVHQILNLAAYNLPEMDAKILRYSESKCSTWGRPFSGPNQYNQVKTIYMVWKSMQQPDYERVRLVVDGRYTWTTVQFPELIYTLERAVRLRLDRQWKQLSQIHRDEFAFESEPCQSSSVCMKNVQRIFVQKVKIQVAEAKVAQLERIISLFVDYPAMLTDLGRRDQLSVNEGHIIRSLQASIKTLRKVNCLKRAFPVRWLFPAAYPTIRPFNIHLQKFLSTLERFPIKVPKYGAIETGGGKIWNCMDRNIDQGGHFHPYPKDIQDAIVNVLHHLDHYILDNVREDKLGLPPPMRTQWTPYSAKPYNKPTRKAVPIFVDEPLALHFITKKERSEEHAFHWVGHSYRYHGKLPLVDDELDWLEDFLKAARYMQTNFPEMEWKAEDREPCTAILSAVRSPPRNQRRLKMLLARETKEVDQMDVE